MNLDELAIEHPYYCSANNYYSNDASSSFPNWNSFYSEFKDLDIDMNYCFRFDIRKYNDGTFYMECFFMQQRKGKFVPVQILSISEDNIEEINQFLKKHYEYTKKIWQPLSINF